MINNAQRAPFMAKQRTFIYEGKYDIRTAIDAQDEIWLSEWDILNAISCEVKGKLDLLSWKKMLNKLSSKQRKLIKLRKLRTPDSFEYIDVSAVNISGVYALVKKLKARPSALIIEAADKFWKWVMAEAVFPMLKFANKDRDEEAECEKREECKKREPERRSVSRANRNVSIREFAEMLKFNGFDISIGSLIKFFRRCEWIIIDRRGVIMPTPFALNSGLFDFGLGLEWIIGSERIRPVVLTVKGQWYFIRMFAVLKMTGIKYACEVELPEKGIDLSETDARFKRLSKKTHNRCLDAMAEVATDLIEMLPQI